MSSTKFAFFGPIRKTRWLPWPLIGWDIFDFSETTKRKSIKLDRKQDLNVLYHVCVFRADRKNKMAALASDWLRYFLLLLWNRWTEFNETWQEARSQCPLRNRWMEFNETWQEARQADWKNKMAALASDWLRHFRLLLCNHWAEFNETCRSKTWMSSTEFVFFGPTKKQDCHPCLWLAETFSTSPLKPLNGIQRNLTGSKIHCLPLSLCFSDRWVNKNCRTGHSVKQVAHWASCFSSFFWKVLFLFPRNNYHHYNGNMDEIQEILKDLPDYFDER